MFHKFIKKDANLPIICALIFGGFHQNMPNAQIQCAPKRLILAINNVHM